METIEDIIHIHEKIIKFFIIEKGNHEKKEEVKQALACLRDSVIFREKALRKCMNASLACPMDGDSSLRCKQCKHAYTLKLVKECADKIEKLFSRETAVEV